MVEQRRIYIYSASGPRNVLLTPIYTQGCQFFSQPTLKGRQNCCQEPTPFYSSKYAIVIEYTP